MQSQGTCNEIIRVHKNVLGFCEKEENSIGLFWQFSRDIINMIASRSPFHFHTSIETNHIHLMSYFSHNFGKHKSNQNISHTAHMQNLQWCHAERMLSAHLHIYCIYANQNIINLNFHSRMAVILIHFAILYLFADSPLRDFIFEFWFECFIMEKKSKNMYVSIY